MAVCVGCGLVEVDGEVSVATSADWGDAPLDVFGGDDSVGGPVYCSEDGKLRTAPPSTSNAISASCNSAVGAAYGGAAVAVGPACVTVIANPSATRTASVLITYSVKWQLAVTSPGVALLADIIANGVDVGPIGKSLSYPGAYSTEEYVTESFSGTIAPGGTLTFSVTPRADPNGGGGVGRLTAQGVGVRAMVVTQ